MLSYHSTFHLTHNEVTLTFVLVPSRCVIVLFGISLSLLYEKNTFFRAQQEKEDEDNDIGENYCLKAERMHIGLGNQEPGEVVPVLTTVSSCNS